MKEQSVNAYENLNKYLIEEFNVTLSEIDSRNDDDDDGDKPWYDRQLSGLVQDYVQEQRKEGYKKGFEDGENADG